ncbi:MAG TPA: hypothetical protein VNG51_15245 [Ktedonobacteraceae bacterium]|nr:hypothetical protein [Ktedonobacteraceae bacterium]
MTTHTLSQKELIDISLSREELYVVMRLLKAQALPGFDLSWLKRGLDGLVSDDIRQELEVATNALIARGYITDVKPSSETSPLTMSMPSPLIALVGTCAFANYNVLLALHTKQGQRQMYLHQLREPGVVHTMPLPDIHQFEAVDGRTGILRVIDATLGLHKQTSLVLPAGKALVVDVQAARDAALAGRVDEAEGLLLRGGLPTVTAQVLSRAMKAATALGAISIIKRNEDGEPQATTLALVITPTMCFTLADDAPGTHPATFLVQPVSAEALQRWITDTLP